MLGQQIGKYRITRQIGRGGMGAIFEAVHESIGQRVAVKVLHESLSAEKEVLTRFFNEARAVNIVQHPGLVRISDFGQLESGTAYLVMEYLDGESLAARLQRLGGKLPRDMSLRITRQIASALRATHEKDIVHRDLKPENVYIIPDPEAPSGERAKLLDFGVAKVRAAATAGGAGTGGPQVATVSGALMGTPLYMAPEQFRGAGAVDGKADVYALGVMLYQMLAGRTPFVSEGMGALMMMHMQDPPPPLREVAPDAPEELCGLVHRMLAKAPEERPSMADVVAELSEIGGGPPTVQLLALGTEDKDDKEPTEVAAPPLSTLGLANGAAEPSPPGPGLRRRGGAAAAAGTVLLLVLLWGLSSHRHKPAVPAPRPMPTIAPAPLPAQRILRCMLDSEPQGAQVLDRQSGKALGATPYTMEQAEGTSDLLLRRQGFADEPVKVQSGAACPARVKLQPTAPAAPPIPALRLGPTKPGKKRPSQKRSQDEYVPPIMH